MRATLVDSSVLLDIATEDPRWLEWSEEHLVAAANDSILIINPIIYAEVSVNYDSVEELDHHLPRERFKREPLPYDAGFLAGKAYVKYKKRGGKRTSPMPDFYIGAHAAVSGLRILTRDPRKYRQYFPSVELISP